MNQLHSGNENSETAYSGVYLFDWRQHGHGTAI
jgi:hypothetical protein